MTEPRKQPRDPAGDTATLRTMPLSRPYDPYSGHVPVSEMRPQIAADAAEAGQAVPDTPEPALVPPAARRRQQPPKTRRRSAPRKTRRATP